MREHSKGEAHVNDTLNVNDTLIKYVINYY